MRAWECSFTVGVERSGQAHKMASTAKQQSPSTLSAVLYTPHLETRPNEVLAKSTHVSRNGLPLYMSDAGEKIRWLQLSADQLLFSAIRSKHQHQVYLPASPNYPLRHPEYPQGPQWRHTARCWHLSFLNI